MKRHNIILTMLLAAFIVRGAHAADTAAQMEENAGLDEVQALLERLATAQALELNDDSNFCVKKSVMDKLRSQGRLSVQPASNSNMCQGPQ